jgi:peptide chain release factor 2
VRCGPGSKRCGGIFDVASHLRRLEELDARAAAATFWENPAAARAVIAETNRHRAVVRPFQDLVRLVEDAQVLTELAAGEADSAARAAAEAEVAALTAKASRAFRNLELTALLSGRFDANNAYLTLHAGAGGTESCDWADMLFRMYRRYCETRGFELEIEDYQAGEEAGIKSVTFAVLGPYAYGYMSAERGVHRLVRISPFDSNKRRHTSFAALDVVAEVDDDIEVELPDTDLRIDTYRSGGAGGQHVNRTDSAVRITHMPTGIVVACQAERSQHKNKSKAMKMLRARVYEWNQDRQRKDLEKFYGNKGEIAWGSQIRSYVLQPYTLAKDHRTEHETSSVQAVLDGELQEFIEVFMKQRVRDAGGTA